MLTRVLHPSLPVHLGMSLRPLGHGSGDPCMRLERDEVWRATITPEGPATEHLTDRGGAVEVEAWGPGAPWLLEAAPELVGVLDDPAGFEPAHPLLRDLHRRHPGLRMGRSCAVTEGLVPTIIEQKVTGSAARRSYRALVLEYGRPAPGPADLYLPPEPGILKDLPYHAFHPLGIERRRAETIRNACARAALLEATKDMERRSAWSRLTALPGIGAWTAAITCRVALGDPDTVEIGDFHIPNRVAWALAGEPRGSDERMLELLEPYAGHRGRAVRLLEVGGPAAPRYGPRLADQSIGGL